MDIVLEDEYCLERWILSWKMDIVLEDEYCLGSMDVVLEL